MTDLRHSRLSVGEERFQASVFLVLTFPLLLVKVTRIILQTVQARKKRNPLRLN